MSSAWSPVRRIDDVPDDRIVQVMQRGGIERLACRIETSVCLNLPDAKRVAEHVPMIVDAITVLPLTDVIAWRDIPQGKPMPVACCTEPEPETLDRIAA